MTQVSVRLDDKISEGLKKASEKLHIRRSDIIRMALAEFLKNAGIMEEEDNTSIYDRLKPFIGVTHSGIKDLSTNPKTSFKNDTLSKIAIEEYVA